MSATASSSQGRTAAILQQPLPQATRSYLDKLARQIEARGDGLTEDDLWKARARLRGIPIETLRRWLTVRITSTAPEPQASNNASSINPGSGERLPILPRQTTQRHPSPELAKIDRSKRNRYRIETSSDSDDAPARPRDQLGHTKQRPISVGSSPPVVAPLRSVLRKGGVGPSSRVQPRAQKIIKPRNGTRPSPNRAANTSTTGNSYSGTRFLSIADSELASESELEPSEPQPVAHESVQGGVVQESPPRSNGSRQRIRAPTPFVRRSMSIDSCSSMEPESELGLSEPQPIAHQSVQGGAVQESPPRSNGSRQRIRAPTPFVRRSMSIDSRSSMEYRPSPELSVSPELRASPAPVCSPGPNGSPEHISSPEPSTVSEPSAGAIYQPTAAIGETAGNHDLARVILGFGNETITDMVGRLYRATAKFFGRRPGVPAERFRPEASHSHAQQIQVWQMRREELVVAAQKRKEFALRNPRRELLKRERANLRSALGPYWRHITGQGARQK